METPPSWPVEGLDPIQQLGPALPVPDVEAPIKAAIRGFYDRLAARRETFRRRNRYYYRLLLDYLRFLIPPGKSILEVGCGDGYVLRRLKPARGFGCDLSERMIEKARLNAAPGERIVFAPADIETTRFTT